MGTMAGCVCLEKGGMVRGHCDLGARLDLYRGAQLSKTLTVRNAVTVSGSFIAKKH